jgi:hypothetical protein
VPASLIRVLESEPARLFLPKFTQWQVPLSSTVNQELRLLRLTLPAGTSTDAHARTGPGLVYVLEGTITTSGASIQPATYGAGDLFLDPGARAGLTFRNVSGSERATLLLYHVSEMGAPLPAR